MPSRDSCADTTAAFERWAKARTFAEQALSWGADQGWEQLPPVSALHIWRYMLDTLLAHWYALNIAGCTKIVSQRRSARGSPQGAGAQ